MKSLFQKYIKMLKEDFLSYRSHIVTNLPIILDCKKWPERNKQLMSSGDDKINALKVYLIPLLEKNYCKIGRIMFEWDC